MHKTIYTFDPAYYNLDEVLHFNQDNCELLHTTSNDGTVGRIEISDNKALESFIEKVGDMLQGFHVRCFDTATATPTTNTQNLMDSSKVKLHDEDDYEQLCTLRFDRLFEWKYPRAYKAKLDELTNQGLAEAEAKTYMLEMEVDLELYYEENAGFFAVESDAVKSGVIYSPYTGIECERSEC